MIVAKKNNTTTEVLSPTAIEWEIGEKTYEQKPLRLDKLSSVLQEIIDTVLTHGNENLINRLVSGDNNDTAAMAPMLLQILISVPKSLPKIVALCLDQPKKEKEILEAPLTGRQGLKIVRAFIDQNEIADLLQDFFGLMGDLGMNQETETAQSRIADSLEKLEVSSQKE